MAEYVMLYVPIERFRHILDSQPNTVFSALWNESWAGRHTKAEKGYIYFSFSTKTLKRLMESSNNNYSLLAFLGYQALKTIAGRRRGQWVNTSNWLFVSRMAGFRTFGDMQAETIEEIGMTFWRLTQMKKYRFMEICKRIREDISQSYPVEFRNSETCRGWDFRIIEPAQQTQDGEFWAEYMQELPKQAEPAATNERSKEYIERI